MQQDTADAVRLLSSSGNQEPDITISFVDNIGQYWNVNRNECDYDLSSSDSELSSRMRLYHQTIILGYMCHAILDAMFIFFSLPYITDLGEIRSGSLL